MTQQPYWTFHNPPPAYDRRPEYKEIVSEKDRKVSMRDGVDLVIDVHRPLADARFPVLLAFGMHSKEIQGPSLPREFPSQPAWSSLWMGHMEAGDTQYFVSRGYVHVIGSARGMHKSGDGGSREWDSYDLVEWIVRQPWCDGNVGMVGIGAFGAEQFYLAKQGSPHLKAIFAFDAIGAYGPFGSFREEYPGGVMHVFRYMLDHFSGHHANKGAPTQMPAAQEELWRRAIDNPDYRMYTHVLNVLNQKGQHMPFYFDVLIDPYDKEEVLEASGLALEKISVLTYCGSGWPACTYNAHLIGAQNYFAALVAPKKMVLTGPAHLDRPLRALRSEMLRWHDHWLKGMDTGMMGEPPVKYWVMGANEWRQAADWPLPETQWTKLYLNSWERLTPEPFAPSSIDEYIPPDAFVQMPPTQTNRVAKLRFLSDPLPRDVLVAGPIALTLFAAIDQDDTNWIVVLKDVGPDPMVRTAREGERELSAEVPERELTRGWLKASNRALDIERSKPWKPWHRLTREACEAVTPHRITEYAIEILATANLFRRGHRICLELASQDFATGVAGATNVEYIPNHIGSSRTTLHKIFHDVNHPSHLLLPFIPDFDAVSARGSA